MLHAIGDLPLQRLPRALLHVFMGEQCFSLCPALNTFKQRAGLVPCRLPGGLRGIQVDMRLDKRRQRQPAFGIQHVAAPLQPLRLWNDMHDPPLLNGQLP
ncbi:hypothetical protein D3C80_1860010 [compost metagenome]